ncbi:MAG TPA: hypothetical protein VFI15_10730 [Candidatus Limnocylindrales bacterium]|nr:hypothetical protein [Candidatus Limnocylindrales bacterium]
MSFPRPDRPRAGLLVTVGAAVALFVAACGGGAATPTPTTSTGASVPAATVGTAAPGATSAAVTKVSANTATESELVAALTAAGVPNADRWAREVMEYRPYAADDPTLQHLQDNLAKYNPDPATLAGILAALEP